MGQLNLLSLVANYYSYNKHKGIKYCLLKPKIHNNQVPYKKILLYYGDHACMEKMVLSTYT